MYAHIAYDIGDYIKNTITSDGNLVGKFTMLRHKNKLQRSLDRHFSKQFVNKMIETINVKRNDICNSIKYSSSDSDSTDGVCFNIDDLNDMINGVNFALNYE